MVRRSVLISGCGLAVFAAIFAPVAGFCADLEASDAATVPELIVTAQKRSQNAQQVGTAMTVAHPVDTYRLTKPAVESVA